MRSIENCDPWIKLIDKCGQPGAVILNIAYGYTIEPFHRDHMVHIINLALDHFARAATPGTWTVDIIPVHEYYDYFAFQEVSKPKVHSETYPLLVPRRSLQADSPGLKGAVDRYSGYNLRIVKAQMEDGKFKPSYLSSSQCTRGG